MIQKPVKGTYSLWDKRIPTLLGLFLIIIGIAITSYFVEVGYIPFLRASPTENPQNIRITNITDASFTITYTTPAQVIGSVLVDKTQALTSGQVFLDDRDQVTGIPAPHSIHSITVRNLSPKTLYYFSITSGQTTYLNKGTPFTTTTGPTITDTPTNEDPLSGLVISPTGNPIDEALIYVTLDGGQTVSTLLKASGLYLVPLNTLRTQDLSSYVKLTSDTKIQLLAIGDNMQSQAIILASRRNPVPTLTLSNNYDFTTSTTPLASTSALPIGFPVFALDTSIQATPKIDNPSPNENFSDAQPVLSGKALPNATVAITIHSDQALTTTVTADQYGNWSYRPSSPLSPGQHTLTIQTKDQNGIMETIQQTFNIFQSGTQVAEAATPSATIGPSQAPSPTQTPTPTIQPTTAPSVTPGPTSSITITPKPTVQSLLITGTPSKQIPATGNDSAITAGIAGVATTVVGILLFLSTRGATL